MIDERLRTVIFAGTTEGRELSSRLIARGIPHTVCVATQYGEMMCESNKKVLIKEGRLDTDEMGKLFDNGTETVVDATHPYATEVSENIIKAAKDKGISYIRVLRDESGEQVYPGCVRVFDTLDECMDSTCKIQGNILITTGSKELAAIAGSLSDISRVYVRVLPSVEAIAACESAGIRNDHIIALHGPFSLETNLALIKQYSIKCVISKQSGRTGGTDEKIAACKEAGIPCFLIKRPIQGEGVSVNEAEQIVVTHMSCKPATDVPKTIRISLIGAGPGDVSGLTFAASEAVGEADMVFGASRLLESATCKNKYPYFFAEDIVRTISELINDMDYKIRGEINAAVLFSGDIGLYSGASGFEDKVREANKLPGYNLEFVRYPGISSVSAFAARLGIDYSDALIISLHKKNSDHDYMAAAAKIAKAPKAFVLLSSGDDIAALADKLCKVNADVTFTIGRRLSYDDEEIINLSLSEAMKFIGKGLYIAYIVNNTPKLRRLLPYISDDEFARNKTPMTKGLIRHECVRLLNLKEGDVLYDIGSGTGSVCIEAACLSNSLSVYSFEKNKDAIDIQRQNIERFGCDNITLIEGMAPDTLTGVKEPDSVFVGGSSGRLGDIIAYLKKMNKRIRVVITAITIETMSEVSMFASDEAVSDFNIEQLSASVAKEIGSYHLLESNNPVMIVTFNLGSIRNEED